MTASPTVSPTTVSPTTAAPTSVFTTSTTFYWSDDAFQEAWWALWNTGRRALAVSWVWDPDVHAAQQASMEPQITSQLLSGVSGDATVTVDCQQMSTAVVPPAPGTPVDYCTAADVTIETYSVADATAVENDAAGAAFTAVNGGNQLPTVAFAPTASPTTSPTASPAVTSPPSAPPPAAPLPPGQPPAEVIEPTGAGQASDGADQISDAAVAGISAACVVVAAVLLFWWWSWCSGHRLLSSRMPPAAPAATTETSEDKLAEQQKVPLGPPAAASDATPAPLPSAESAGAGELPSASRLPAPPSRSALKGGEGETDTNLGVWFADEAQAPPKASDGDDEADANLGVWMTDAQEHPSRKAPDMPSASALPAPDAVTKRAYDAASMQRSGSAPRALFFRDFDWAIGAGGVAEPDAEQARHLNALGMEANREGDYRSALEHFLEAHAIDPDSSNYMLSAANMHLCLGEAAEARAKYVSLLSWPQPLSRRHHMMVRSQLAEAARQLETAAAGECGGPVGVPSRLVQTRSRGSIALPSPDRDAIKPRVLEWPSPDSTHMQQTRIERRVPAQQPPPPPPAQPQPQRPTGPTAFCDGSAHVGSAASAQEQARPAMTAKRLGALGMEASRSSDYRSALELFLRAHAIDPDSSNYMLSAANMHLCLGEAAEARAKYVSLLSWPQPLSRRHKVMVQNQLASAVRLLEGAARADDGAPSRLARSRTRGSIAMPAISEGDDGPALVCDERARVQPSVREIASLQVMAGTDGDQPTAPDSPARREWSGASAVFRI